MLAAIDAVGTRGALRVANLSPARIIHDLEKQAVCQRRLAKSQMAHRWTSLTWNTVFHP